MFYDVNSITYDKLLKTTQYQKPYRDSGNAYPLGDRRYSARHFRKESDGSFSIWYLNREITDKVLKGDEDLGDYYKNRKPLAVVYPDNTMEFTDTNFHQGDRCLFSELIGRGGTIQQIKSKGGVVFYNSTGAYPVFVGLRISLDTYKPVTKFEVIQPTLNRKRSNEAMKQYKDFLNTYPMFIKSLDEKSAVSVITDMYQQMGEDNFMKINAKDIKDLVDKKFYLDAAMGIYLEAMPWFRSTIRYYMKNDGYMGGGHPRMASDWQDNVMYQVQKKFRKLMLSTNDSVFDWVALPEGVLKSSEWDHKIIVDGNKIVTQV